MVSSSGEVEVNVEGLTLDRQMTPHQIMTAVPQLSIHSHKLP